MPIRYYVMVAFLLAVMVAANLPNLAGQSPTVDEYAQVPAGYSYLLKRDFRLYPKTPPLIKIICALPLTAVKLNFPLIDWLDAKGAWGPWYFADKFAAANQDKILRVYAFARAMNILLGVILGLVVFLWASKLYGHRAGLVALAFTATSPTILAHAGVATVDVGFTLFFVLALFTFWRCFDLAVLARLIVAGVIFGAAQLSKFTAVLLAPFLIIISLAMLVRNIVAWKKIISRPKAPLRRILFDEAICVLIIFAVGLVTIHAGYFFRYGVSSLNGTVGASRKMQALSKSVMARVPILLPEEYLQGMDLQLADTERGEFPNYLNGKWRRKGAWYYFLEAMSLKETVPALIYILLGMGFGAYRLRGMSQYRGERDKVPAWPFVHLPALLFLIVISLSGNLQLGIRYALPLLPLAFIAASGALFRKKYYKVILVGNGEAKLSLVQSLSPDDRKKVMGFIEWFVLPVLIFGLFVWQCVEVIRVEPHYLSHFNQIAGGVGGGPRYLLDSNVDWGQDLPALAKKMKEKDIKEIGLIYFGHADPSWYGIKWHLPTDEDRYVAVSVNFLKGYPYSLTYLGPWKIRPPMITDPEYLQIRNMAIYLDQKIPIDRAGGSINIYELSSPSGENRQ